MPEWQIAVSSASDSLWNERSITRKVKRPIEEAMKIQKDSDKASGAT